MKHTLFKLFWGFLKIGALTIGGGYAMIPVIEHELVRKQKLINQKDFDHLLIIAQSAPGPIAVNTSILAGYRLYGAAGSAVSAAGAMLAPAVIMILIAAFLGSVIQYPRISALFAAVRGVVVGLIAATSVKIAWRAGKLYVPLSAAGFLVLLIFLRINPFFLIPGAAIAGAVYEIIKTKKNNHS